MVKKAIGYIRVSTEQQKEQNSHIRQREKLREWAENGGYELDLVEDIAVSGQEEDREGYQELMDSFQSYDVVVVRELSRLGREATQVLNDMEKIMSSDTDFVSLKEDHIDSTSAEGKLLLRIIASFNQFYADLKREQALEMIQKRKEKGKNVGRKRKLNDTQMEKVREWREANLSYEDISRMVKLEFDKEIDRSTIYRYCDKMEIEE
jgi:DNA invertase Pin-like site-specific DNA recombinase